MNPKLSESFSNNYIQDYVEKNLKIGAVLRFNVFDTTPPKIKRMVIIGISSNRLSVAVLYFNSEINPNLFPTQELKQLHLKFKKQNRNYLDKNCFLDCSQLFEKTFEAIKNLLLDNPDYIPGELSTKDIHILKSTVKTARTIPVKLKKRYNLYT